ncbi:MAG TPA: DUF6456 domain-containing protein [Micropepsaceae bacterium]|nr:DUF6456 domain-containing protein [Micropepsaceae bacterium]
MSAPGLAEGEIAREARRVLRRLMARDAALAPNPAGAGYALMAPGREGVKQRLIVSAVLVEAFLRRDWIAPALERAQWFVLSDPGLGWVKRALADENPFATQHRIETRRAIAAPDGTSRTLTVNDGESPLGWLFRRKGPDGRPLITEWQFKAGERLRTDFTLAQLNPRLGVDLTAPVVAGRRGAKSDTLSETVLAAKQRFARAIAFVGPGLSDLLIDVCCHLTGLEAAEKQKGWPQRSAKIVLQIALDRLVRHYRMGPVVGTGSGVRAWAAEES